MKLNKYIILAIIILIFITLAPYFIRQILFRNDALPDTVDVIFSLGGGFDRIEQGALLRHSYPHATWIISTKIANPKQFLAKRAIDTTGVVIVDSCTNTVSEIRYLKSYLAVAAKATRPLSTGIVSLSWHLPRVSMIYEKLSRHDTIAARPFYHAVNRRIRFQSTYQNLSAGKKIYLYFLPLLELLKMISFSMGMP